MARPEDVHAAIASWPRAWQDWSRWTWEDRAAVFLKAADLLAGPWRDTINAATMLGQSKTVLPVRDRRRLRADRLLPLQRRLRAGALHRAAHQRTQDVEPVSDYRALEGFVYAVTPFNFTAIGGNLSGAPALMGNTVLWKPAATAMLSSWYYVYKLLEEAGLPTGVINFVPGDAVADVRHRAVASPRPGRRALHRQHRRLQQRCGRPSAQNMANYRAYPRIVGETGGKDFMIAHPSADTDRLRRGHACAAPSSTRARSARPLAGLHPALASGPRSRSSSSP
jgi:1-pyrroline-5-carboxylate dehydrogenase